MLRLALLLLTVLTLSACGSVSRMTNSHPSSTPDQPVVPGAPTPDPGGPSFVTVVLKAGVDPAAMGQRIGGPGATVLQVPQIHEENVPQTIMRRTFRVSLVKGQATEALRKAKADPGVARAYLGEYPGQYPDPPF
jgi:hypothetical protein